MHEKSGISLYNVPPLPNETATDFAIILILVVVAVTFAGCQPRPASAIVAIDASATPPGGEFGTEMQLPGVKLTDQLLVSPTQSFGAGGFITPSLTRSRLTTITPLHKLRIRLRLRSEQTLSR